MSGAAVSVALVSNSEIAGWPVVMYEQATTRPERG
jgi:hypothetical protein